MDGGDEARGGEQGVPALGHRGRSRVVLPPGESRLEAVDADDALDDAQAAAVALQGAALLHMEFEEGPHGPGIEDGAVEGLRVFAVPLQPFVEAHAVGSGAVEFVAARAGGGRPAAEEAVAEVGALLVAPDRHLQRVPGLDPLLPERPQDFECAEDAERPVVVPAPGHGVEMRTEEDRREGLAAFAAAEEVARRVGADGEPGGLHLRRQPLPRRPLLRGEGDPPRAALGVRPEPGQSFKRPLQPGGVGSGSGGGRRGHRRVRRSPLILPLRGRLPGRVRPGRCAGPGRSGRLGARPVANRAPG